MRLQYILDSFPIYTNRLKIRAMSKSDIKWYVDQIKLEHYSKYLDDTTPKSISKEKFREAFSNLISLYNKDIDFKIDIRLIIADKNSSTKYGSIVIFSRMHDNMHELAYWLDEQYENKGIAYESLNAVINILNNIGITNLMLEIQKKNIKSIKLAEKCGFIHTGGTFNNCVYTINKGVKQSEGGNISIK